MADVPKGRGAAKSPAGPGLAEEELTSKIGAAAHAAKKDAADRSFGYRSLVRAWKGQQDADRKMREVYARRLIWLLIGQVIAINVTFLLLGWKVFGFTIEPWTARTFVVTAFLEVASLVLIVAKNLFPPSSNRALELIGRLDAREERTKAAGRKQAAKPRSS